MIVIESKQLRSLCQKIKQQQLIAVDTEFFREITYYPKLCLIQIAFPTVNSNKQEVFAIDTLSKIDLQPFWEILKDPKITKIFHAGKEDIEIFFHLMGEMPKSVIDTQVMAAFCGISDTIGYGQLVEKLLNIRLDKGQQRSDWTQRPLSEKQIKYALLDVEHLIELYRVLEAKLTEDRKIKWIEEEMSSLVNSDKYYNLNDLIRHKFHIVGKPLSYIKIIKKLVSWREEKARAADVIRNFVLKDEVLINIAQKRPDNINQLQKVKGINNKTVEAIGNEIVDIVTNALKIPDEYVLENIEEPLTSKQALIDDLLKIVLELKAKEVRVNPRLIASKYDIQAIASKRKKVKDVFRGWKYEVLGTFIEKILSGKMAIKIECENIDIVNI